MKLSNEEKIVSSFAKKNNLKWYLFSKDINSTYRLYNDICNDDYYFYISEIKNGEAQIKINESYDPNKKFKKINQNPFNQNPFKGISYYKRQYLTNVYRFLQTGSKEIGHKAALYEEKLRQLMSDDDFKYFIHEGSKAFQKGKVKSKSYITLLKRLDNETKIRYNPFEKKKVLYKNITESEKEMSKLYESFNHFKPEKNDMISIDLNVSKNKLDVIKLGEMPEIVYISNKDIDDKGIKNRKQAYIHKFKQYLPIYTNGKVLIIPLEKQNITDRGLIYDKTKKEIRK